MKIKKQNLGAVLITINSTKTENGITTVCGLLNENISLGTKRRLQKILKESYTHFTEYQKDRDVVKDNPEELAILNTEEVTIDCEPVSLAMIEAIETENNYDWDIIEKITQ